MATCCFSSLKKKKKKFQQRYTADFSFDPMNQQRVMHSSICDPDTRGHDLKPFILGQRQPHVTLISVCTITFKPTEQSPPSTRPSLTRDVPVNRTWQAGSRPAGRNGQGQVKQLFAVIWKWSLWVVNTVVTSRSPCAHATATSAPDHARCSWDTEARYCQKGLSGVWVKSSVQIKTI